MFNFIFDIFLQSVRYEFQFYCYILTIFILNTFKQNNMGNDEILGILIYIDSISTKIVLTYLLIYLHKIYFH